MDTKNIKYLQEWILSKKVLETNKIRDIIQAFSEYIVATNPDYLYNKTYLIAFIDDFLNCTDKLKKKKDICEDILNKIKQEGISTEDIIIRINRALISKYSNIELANTFDFNNSVSSKIKYEIEYVGEKSFVVANSININVQEEHKVLEKDIDLFIKKYNEEIV